MSKLSHVVILSVILGFSLTGNVFADEPVKETTTQTTTVVQPATDIVKKTEVTEEKVTTEVTKSPVVKKTVKKTVNKVNKCGCKNKCRINTIKKAEVDAGAATKTPTETSMETTTTTVTTEDATKK